METVKQNGRFTLFSSKFHSDIYSIIFDYQAKRDSTKNEPSLFSEIYVIFLIQRNKQKLPSERV